METHQLPSPATNRAYSAQDLIVYAGPAWQRDPQVYKILAAQLQHTPIWCLDGGGRFNQPVLGRIVRQMYPENQAALQRFHLQRVENCLHLNHMLNPAEALPGLACLLDPLTLFESEAVPLAARTRLLAALLEQIEDLLLTNPVLVSTARAEGHISGGAEWLLHLLNLASVRVLFERAPQPALGRQGIRGTS